MTKSADKLYSNGVKGVDRRALEIDAVACSASYIATIRSMLLRIDQTLI